MARKRRWQRWVVIAIVVLAMLGLVLPMAMTARAATPGTAGGPADEETSGAADDGATAGEIVVVGMAGVRWDDLSALATPHLWSLAERGASANLVARSVRSFSCPVDGWLALSAGRRAADVPMPTYGACRRLAGPGEDGVVPAWDTYLEAAAVDGYDAAPGTLGDLLTAADVPTLAVGPGAAVALATSDGVVAGDYRPGGPDPELLHGVLGESLPGHDLTVVDVGAVRDHNRPLVGARPTEQLPVEEPDPDETPSPDPDEAWMLAAPGRSEQVARIDERVGAVLAAVRAEAPDATVVLASLADSGSVAMMQVAIVDGPALTADVPDGGAALQSRSTRQPGMIQSTDLTPTLVGILGLDPPAGLVGAPVRAEPDGRSGPDRVAALADENDHAVAVRPVKGPFHSGLVLVNLLLYAAVTIGLNRRVLDRGAAWFARRRAGGVAAALRSRRPQGALRAVRTAAVAVGALPVSSFLANLLPWWRMGTPALVHLASTLLITTGVTALALARPWRHRLLAPVAVVAGLTALVLAADVLTGARLQVSALMGIQPEVGGRFYGFNNSSFSLFAAATILVATCLAEPLVEAGRRRLAGAVIALVGLVAVVLDGAPAIGADFGGPPALAPGFLVLALLAAGIRLTWQRIVLVLGVTGVLVAGFSLLDWLRPADERTHLGRFVETVLGGGLWSVLERKLTQNLANLFGSTLTLLAIGGIVVVALILTKPLREAARSGRNEAYAWLAGDGSAARTGTPSVMLRPVLVALTVTFLIAFAANDSGIVLPAIGISLAVPLLVTVLMGWLLARAGEGHSSGDVGVSGVSGVAADPSAGASDQAR
ncbi:hypothetical protein [Georgenia alba]|uniref:Alkaline phosphatase family protein n=1 Tax=Georgenia alba TaxID=2233858 RepID=A0ABW2Q471_9MICO